MTTSRSTGETGNFQNTICSSLNGSACDGPGALVLDNFNSFVVNSTADTDDYKNHALGCAVGFSLLA